MVVVSGVVSKQKLTSSLIKVVILK